MILSNAAWSLWGKKGKTPDSKWLPLPQHMEDSARIAALLWERWLPDKTRHFVEKSLSHPDGAEVLLRFLGAAHDLGKATPVFQAKTRGFLPDDLDQRLMEGLHFAGLPCVQKNEFISGGKTPHALATEHLLRFAGCKTEIAAILGAHHGKPASADMLLTGAIGNFPYSYHMGKEGKSAWFSVQKELLEYALSLSGAHSLDELPSPDFFAQVLLSGIVVMTDWIASNERLFPYLDLDEPPKRFPRENRAEAAWEKLNLPKAWMRDPLMPAPDYYQDRFLISQPYPAQREVLKIAEKIVSPGILILEAPMGSGKTEAALAAAEIFAEKAQLDGVFFALPTQATSNAMFPRLLDWTRRLDLGSYSVRLAHGKAQFNSDYASLLQGSRGIGESADDAVVHQWFEGGKKSLLADFVVGTIDQFLMAALRHKFIMLRHLGLSGKVVILDECHAYDAYMNQYLDRTLSWMGAYGVPVIVLSATLPAKRRAEMIYAYLGRPPAPKNVPRFFKKTGEAQAAPAEWTLSRGYPLVTWTDGSKVEQKTVPEKGESRKVRLALIEEEQAEDTLRELLKNGGRAGVILNTVSRAQRFAASLSQAFGDENVTLIHARFIAPDRAEKEDKILKLVGKGALPLPKGGAHIVVGTQVIEQSLDLDFDVLLTDLCPMDLLMQRIGRLHRHARTRPEGLESAACYIMGASADGFEPGALAVYHAYPLMRTKALLPEESLVLPEDIPRLVQSVYDEQSPLPSRPNGYEEAKAGWQLYINQKESRAKAYRLDKPSPAGELTGWLDRDIADAAGEASVRDGGDSVEVSVIRALGNGLYAPLPWVECDQEISAGSVPEAEVSRLLARQSLRLPNALCHGGIIEETIRELEKKNAQLKEWQKSPWLKGILFLILNHELKTSLCGFGLSYHRNFGLTFEKEGVADGNKGLQSGGRALDPGS